MDRISIRAWTWIGAIGLILFASYWMRFSMKRGGVMNLVTSFTYEMPRPKNFEPRFDLSNYEVERQYKTLPTLPAPARPLATKETAKQTPAQKKAAQQLEAKKKAQAAAKAKAEAARKKKLQVSQTDTSRKMGLSVGQTMDSSPEVVEPIVPAAPVAQAKAKVASGDEKDDTKDEVLTPSQWRSLLQTSPTAANVAKFLNAKKEGDIDATSYYEIVHELLVDSAEDRRTAALSLLEQDPSKETFEFMIGQLSVAPADVKTSLDKKIKSYSEASKLSALAQVLSGSKSESVLTEAVSRASEAWALYSQQKSQTTSGVGSTVKSSTSSYTLNQFKGILLGLKKVNKAGALTAQTNSLIQEITAALKT